MWHIRDVGEVGNPDWLSSEVISYRAGSRSRAVLVAAIALGSAFGLFLVVAAPLTWHSMPLALRFLPGVLWIGLAAFFAWSGYHIGYEVKFSRDRLIWLAPFCSQDVRLAEVLHRTRFPSRLAVLEIDGGAHLLVDKRAGFVQFAVALGRAAPHLQVWA